MSSAPPSALTNWIGGQPRPAVSGATLDNVDPATGAVLCTLPRSGPEDVAQAVAAAQAASQGPWAQWSASDRADLLDRVADLLSANHDALALLESEDTGKPLSLARNMDIARAIANFRFFAGAVRHSQTGFTELSDAYSYTLRRPLGVVGLITPWNLPLYLLSWKVAPALACGNTLVAKPSELTPRSADALARLLAQAGLPDGVFNLVHGLGPEAGAPLCAHPDIAALSFTGGTATGRHVGEVAGRTFKKLSLELGGKNATIIFDDADLDDAVDQAVRAAFTNQGQVCLCGSRILLHERIAAAFTKRFVQKVQALTLGDPRSEVALGALSSLAHRDKVESYIQLALSEGGQLACGGTRPTLPAPFTQGAFLRPAVITGLSPTSRTACEEVFGPLVTLHTFSDEAAAISAANTTAYGLSASVFTSDLHRAHRVAGALQVGMVWVNCWLVRDLRSPFGGVKHSGVGREGGQWSLSFYSQERNVTIRAPKPQS